MILSVQDVFLLRLLEHIVNDAILVILVRHHFGRRLDAVLVAAQVPSTFCSETQTFCSHFHIQRGWGILVLQKACKHYITEVSERLVHGGDKPIHPLIHQEFRETRWNVVLLWKGRQSCSLISVAQPLVSASDNSASPVRSDGTIDITSAGIEDQNMWYW